MLVSIVDHVCHKPSDDKRRNTGHIDPPPCAQLPDDGCKVCWHPKCPQSSAYALKVDKYFQYIKK